MTSAMLIDCQILKSEVPDSGTLEERLSAAMKAARLGHGLMFAITEDEQFRTAVGAVMLKATAEEKDLIARSMKPLQILSALQQGIPVDLSQMETENLIPLLPLWHATKETK